VKLGYLKRSQVRLSVVEACNPAVLLAILDLKPLLPAQGLTMASSMARAFCAFCAAASPVGCAAPDAAGVDEVSGDWAGAEPDKKAARAKQTSDRIRTVLLNT